MTIHESEKPSKEAIDVDALVHDLQEDAESKNAPALEPLNEALPEPPPLALHDEVIVSRRPVVGPVVTAVRRMVLKFVRVPVEDLARQTLGAAQAGIAAEAGARERTDRDLGEVTQRLHELKAIAEPLSGLEASFDQLEIAQRVLAHEQRLVSGEMKSRLDGLQATLNQLVAGGPPAVGEPTRPPESPMDGFDYVAFEKRFRPEETVRERQREYVETLKGHEPVVDLGCGRGELVELLGRAGTRAYGVDINSESVEAGTAGGLEIVHADALDHLASLSPGSLGGVVASHVVEHLPGATVGRLVRLAFDRLNDTGVLILETPNPESLFAGSINFHRDLSHTRPIHPDTLEFMCVAAGFDDVTVRRLSQTPDNELLDRVSGDSGDVERALNSVVDTLNAVLYGFQDYAVVARK